MAKVVAYRDKTTGELESVDSLIRRFKKKVENEGILEECKKREFFVGKSMARRLKSIEHQKQVKMRQAKNKNKNID